MNAGTLLLSSAFLLVVAAAGLLWGQRAERRRGRAAGAFVDQRLDGSAGHSRGSPNNTTAGRGEATTDKPAGPRSNAKRGVLAQLRERPLEALPPLENAFVRAGVLGHGKWLLTHAGVGLLLTLIAALFAGWVPALLVLLLTVVASWFQLWLMISRRNRRMVRQLPIFLDALVRQVTVGTSLGSAFQQIAPQTPAPLGEVLSRAAHLNRAGVDLDIAVKQCARIYDVTQLLMIGAVLGVSTRFGGRSDQVLERIAAFMRDMEQAHDELVAMSSETRMSAWILGALPLAVGGFLVIFNNRFFFQMWNDPLGAKMLIGAVGLQIVGSLLLYRLAKSI